MHLWISLPLSKGKDVIFAVVNCLTKYANLIPLTTKFAIYEVVDLFFKNVYKLHGLPHCITCDKYPKFFDNFRKELFKLA